VVPVPNKVPPVRELYQFIIHAEATAPNVTIPESQRFPGVVEVIVGDIVTVAITVVLVDVVHPEAVAST
jgi:hypothetical protein